MAAPARKPRPDAAPDAEPQAQDAPPRLRSAAVRAADATDASQPSGALTLQARVARAFTAPPKGRWEETLMKLIILAATCLFLRTALTNGDAFLQFLR